MESNVLAFVVSGLRGHLYPCVPLIEELFRRGHDLNFLLRDPDDHAFEVLAPFGSVRMVVEGELQAPPGSAGLNTFEGRVQRFRALYIDHERVDATRQFLLEVSPDAVIGDASIWDTIIAARQVDVPFVALHTSLGALAPANVDCERLRIDQALSQARKELFTKHHTTPTEFRRFEAISDFLNLIWTVPELMHEASEAPSNTELVGVSLSEKREGGKAEWETLSNKPLVYVSFGTIYYSRTAVLEAILAGLATLDVHVLLAAPQLPPSFEGQLPDNCSWLPYANQLEALEHADLFVTHGGHSSFLESVCVGVPTLIVPLASDQPIQAFFAEHHQLGAAIPPESLDADAVAATAQRVLVDEDIQASVARFSALYKERGGAHTAANHIERKLNLRQ